MHEPNQDSSAADVRPILDAQSEFFAAIESLDVERIMSCWSDSDQVSLMFPGADTARGVKSVREAWVSLEKYTSQIKVILEPITVMRSGDMGFAFLGGTIVSTHGDETLSVEVYVTNIFRLEASGWKLVHHHSTPAPHQPSYLEQRLT
jgi:ketosteroid isomerase-like protein